MIAIVIIAIDIIIAIAILIAILIVVIIALGSGLRRTNRSLEYAHNSCTHAFTSTSL